MKHLLFALVLVTACGKKKAEEGTAPPPAAGTTVAPAAAGSAAPAPYTPSADVPDPIKAAIAAPDRSDKDRALDAGRKPGEVFAFFKLAPGQRIGELFGGGGYSTDVMARIVGDSGKVYSQNTKEIMDKFARGPMTERAAAHKNVVLVEQPAETPFPADAKNLDAVICILNYHDLVWQNVDRAKMNKAVFDALEPGGVYGIVDHSAADGSGTRDVQTLHRIDEDVVKKEVLAAGFKLDGESQVLRNADDKRDWNDSPKAAAEKRGTSDRFVLRFVKP